MNFEEEVFKKSKVNYNKLIEYGFINKNNYYLYNKTFMNGKFNAIIMVNSKGIVSGKVIDNETKEEYLNLRVKSINGSFVNEVRNKYKDILIDIKNNCFNNYYFVSDQANEITRYIKDKYRDNPEFLWDITPDFGVFRNKNNNKWYAIIMNINSSILNNKDCNVDIINLKLDPDLILELLNKDGYYKAYHMNKKYWITIILDNTVNINDIIKYINYSYDIVNN